MKLAWKSAPLGEICAFSNGLWTGKKAPFEQAIVLRNTNFRAHGRLDYSDAAVLDVESKQLAKRRLQRGDILIEKSGGGPKQPVGRVAYFDKAEGLFSFSNFTSAARVLDQTRVDPRYLVSFLDWCYVAGRTERMQSHSTGIRNLDFNTYKAIDVPLPSLEEQRRIVAVLDEAFAAITTATANAEKNLANARSFADLYLRTFFSTLDAETSPLGSIAEFRNGINFSGGSKGEAIKIIGVKDFQDNLYVPASGLATVQVDVALADIDVLQEGDILTVRSNGNKALIGRCMIAGEQSEKTSHSGFTIRIRATSDKVDPQYLCRVLKSPSIREELVSGGGGANISNLNQKSLGALDIPLPAIEVQKAIVEKLDRIDAEKRLLISNVERKISALSSLKQSLLQCAFTGELTATTSELITA